MGSFYDVKEKKSHNTSGDITQSSSLFMNYFSTSPPHWLKYDTQKTPFVLPYSVVLPAQNPKYKCNTDYCANGALKLKVQQNGDFRISIR